MIKSAERIAGLVVKEEALYAARELEKQVGRPGFQPDDEDSALWITDGSRIIALLVWRRFDAENCGWIGLGWTSLPFRRMGLYRRLVAEFRVVAKAAGFEKIGCGIDRKNSESLATHRALGLVESDHDPIYLESAL